ncbi:MAG: GTPase ObgE [Candidatus Eisenbacteria bacterium]
MARAPLEAAVPRSRIPLEDDLSRFVDRAVIHVESGAGGNGCVSFRREKHVPRGGPDGGDGGRGGDVILVGDPGKRTLLDFRYQSRYRGGRGEHGSGGNRSGKDGEDRLVHVPCGTIVREMESGSVLADLVAAGDRVVVARGGRGGWGNARFATPTNRAPQRAERGGERERFELELELKLLADAGLVGLPNAGKSTLLARVSAARPKIADYPFTTLVPNLGLVRVGGLDSFLLADIPGLIEGASEGRGLGHDFLRHVERCRVLIYLVDATAENPGRDLEVLRKEVGMHKRELLDRPSLVVWNKIDALPEERRAALADGRRWIVSAVSGEGVAALMEEVNRRIREGEDGENV